ncbi:hypothetical protein FHS19_001350 [Paenibacillus rhizosphaerae]|uniref:Thymidylate kinase-like domain-containing protein n=1 Tax=Paenibacillus rhizosphaerae TaxID=297318 RepID=A0A839TIQ6_9BACL|nr:hypothetical protein [Paenibacillus rhizosphaerae]MBB3126696.1 hypothetical protein [Paenibacillus rhizosphaerae]
MIRGVILEGLSTTGKTSVLSALKRVHSLSSHAERTMIALSEHYSQILHSDHGVLRSLDHNEHMKLLNQHISYLEQLHGWIESLGHTKPSNGIFFILERFHLNHRAAFADHSEIEALEQRLLSLNAKCVLLTISREAIPSRFVESRGEAWRKYVMSNHPSADDACRKFVEDQEILRRCMKQSLIPAMEINTDEASWDGYASQILKALDE